MLLHIFSIRTLINNWLRILFLCQCAQPSCALRRACHAQNVMHMYYIHMSLDRIDIQTFWLYRIIPPNLNISARSIWILSQNVCGSTRWGYINEMSKKMSKYCLVILHCFRPSPKISFFFFFLISKLIYKISVCN